jgi:hypothetical protein
VIKGGAVHNTKAEPRRDLKDLIVKIDDLKKSFINLIRSAGDSSNLDRDKITTVSHGVVEKDSKSWLRLSTNLSTKRSTTPLRRIFD